MSLISFFPTDEWNPMVYKHHILYLMNNYANYSISYLS